MDDVGVNADGELICLGSDRKEFIVSGVKMTSLNLLKELFLEMFELSHEEMEYLDLLYFI